MLADLGAQVLGLAALLCGLAREGRRNRESSVIIQFVELSAEVRVLRVDVRLQLLYMRELVVEVLGGGGMLDEGVREGFGGCGGRVECYGCGCECVQGFRAFGREVVSYACEDALVVFSPYNLGQLSASTTIYMQRPACNPHTSSSSFSACRSTRS